jgi:cellulose synthase/poly-beta-1,6-N-acetylglucosamine synthase-like glycosyltransferase
MSKLSRAETSQAVTANALAGVCVVIPAFNEEVLIGRCIQSVLNAGLDASQIYVVDDHSRDNTAARVQAFAGVNLLRHDRNFGKLRGLQHAIDTFDLLNRYEFLALLDADSHIAPEYFAAVLRRFSEVSDAVLVSGAPYSEKYNLITAYRALEYAMTLKVYRKGQDNLGVITVAPGCASTYRTSIFAKLDWDNKTLVEDMDVTVQIHRKKLGRVVYTEHAVAYTQDPRTLREYAGQLTRWYSGTWQVLKLHRIPFGLQRLDAEFTLLIGEGLLYAVLAAMLPLFLYLYPWITLRALAADQILWAAIAAVCAAQLRRADVLWCIPICFVMRSINCYVLLRTFWAEVICSRQTETWFSVSRYSQSTATN